MKEKNITEDAKIGKIREMRDFFIVPLESEFGCAGCVFYKKRDTILEDEEGKEILSCIDMQVNFGRCGNDIEREDKKNVSFVQAHRVYWEVETDEKNMFIDTKKMKLVENISDDCIFVRELCEQINQPPLFSHENKTIKKIVLKTLEK